MTHAVGTREEASKIWKSIKKISLIIFLAFPITGMTQTVIPQATQVSPAQAYEYAMDAIRMRDLMIADDDRLLKAANETITKQRVLIQKQHDLIVKLYAKMGIVAP
jgi:hypothetical protein